MEALEDVGALGLRNAWPVVAHIKQYCIVFESQDDMDRAGRPGMAKRVVDQVLHDGFNGRQLHVAG